MRKLTKKEIMKNTSTVNVTVLCALMGVKIGGVIEAAKAAEIAHNNASDTVYKHNPEEAVTPAWYDKNILTTSSWWIADAVKKYCVEHEGETTKHFWAPMYDYNKISPYIEEMKNVKGCFSDYSNYGRISAKYAIEILTDCGLTVEEIKADSTWKTYASAHFSTIHNRHGKWEGTQKAYAVLEILKSMLTDYKLVPCK